MDMCYEKKKIKNKLVSASHHAQRRLTALGKASMLLITGIKIAPTIIFRRALTTNLLIIVIASYFLAYLFPSLFNESLLFSYLNNYKCLFDFYNQFFLFYHAVETQRPSRILSTQQWTKKSLLLN